MSLFLVRVPIRGMGPVFDHFCVVVLAGGAQIDFFVVEKKKENCRQKKMQLFGKIIAFNDEHLEIPSHRGAVRVGEKKHANSNCVLGAAW